MFSFQSYQRFQYSRVQAAECRARGFSLLEVLIAATVFSLGLAGFAALLLASSSGSTEARREGIAAVAAASLAEQLRVNAAALERYLDPPENISRICNGDNPCTPEQQADYDFRLWQLDLADRIRNARGLVCRDGTPEDGVDGNDQCDGAGPLVIKIFWPAHAGHADGEADQRRYSLETS